MTLNSTLKSLCNQLTVRSCDIFLSQSSALLLVLIITSTVLLIWKYPKVRKYFTRKEYPVYVSIIGLFLLLNLILQFVSPTGGDIREHAHAGFLISRGLVPYADFFEHHNPLYWYLIAPVFLLSTGISALYILYILSSLALVFSCFYLFKIGSILFFDKRISYLMVIYFISIKNVLISYQIRPDPFSTLFLLISFYYLVDAKRITDYVKSGILSGISLLFLQKAMLYVIGFALLILMSECWRRKALFGARASAYFLFGGMLPLGLYLAYLAIVRGEQGLWNYYYLNYRFNLDLTMEYNLSRRIIVWWMTNWGQFLLAIFGLYIIVKEHKKYAASGLILGAQIVNIAVLFYFVYRGIIGPQYFQYSAPFFSIVGAIGFLYLSEKVQYTIEPLYYGVCVLFLLLIPMSLSVLNAATAESDNHEIVFYSENFKGKKTNCNFVFNENHQYKWLYVGTNSDELIARYGIENEKRELYDFIEEGYPVICIGIEDVRSEKELLKSGYAEYRGKGGRSAKVFYRLDGRRISLIPN